MTAITQEIIENPKILYRHTVEEYHRMIASGIIEEGAPYELLDGHVVRKIRSAAGEDPMTVSRRHGLAVMRLDRLNTKLRLCICHMQTQQPLTIPEHDEPGPDGAVVRGFEDDYADHPGAGDVLCVIEVADASLRGDRTKKLALYANAGIGTYVIVNLQDDVAEVYTDPMRGKGRYAQVVTLLPKHTLAIPTETGKPVNVKVKQLLP